MHQVLFRVRARWGLRHAFRLAQAGATRGTTSQQHLQMRPFARAAPMEARKPRSRAAGDSSDGGRTVEAEIQGEHPTTLQSADQFAEALLYESCSRLALLKSSENKPFLPTAAVGKPIVDAMSNRGSGNRVSLAFDRRHHKAIFLERGSRTGVLLCASIWGGARGQAAAPVQFASGSRTGAAEVEQRPAGSGWSGLVSGQASAESSPPPSVEDVVGESLELSRAMGSATAAMGVWRSGGAVVIGTDSAFGLEHADADGDGAGTAPGNSGTEPTSAHGPDGLTLPAVGLSPTGDSQGFGRQARVKRASQRRTDLMLDVADFVGGLRGVVVATGCGGGMTAEDSDVLSAACAFSAGLGRSTAGCERALGREDLAVATAAGTVSALQSAVHVATGVLEHRSGKGQGGPGAGAGGGAASRIRAPTAGEAAELQASGRVPVSPLRGLEATVVGAGFVGRAITQMLLELGIARVKLAERSRGAVARARHALADGRVEVEHAEGHELLGLDSELLIPCGHGPLITPANAGTVGARIVCGPQLGAIQQPAVVSRALASRGRFVVPSEVAGRAALGAQLAETDGILAAALTDDPRVASQLAAGSDGGIPSTTARLLEPDSAAGRWRTGDGYGALVHGLEDAEAPGEPHPMLGGGHMTALLAALLEDGWHKGSQRDQANARAKRLDQRLERGTGLDAHGRWLQSVVYGGWTPGDKAPIRNSIGRGKLPKSVVRHRRPEHTDEQDW